MAGAQSELPQREELSKQGAKIHRPHMTTAKEGSALLGMAGEGWGRGGRFSYATFPLARQAKRGAFPGPKGRKPQLLKAQPAAESRRQGKWKLSLASARLGWQLGMPPPQPSQDLHTSKCVRHVYAPGPRLLPHSHCLPPTFAATLVSFFRPPASARYN